MFVNNGISTWVQAEVIDNEVRFTLTKLSRACGVDDAEIIGLVEEGVVQGVDPNNVFFNSHALSRARTALRLLRDLELNAHATALVLDLLDQIDDLRIELTHWRAQAGLR